MLAEGQGYTILPGGPEATSETWGETPDWNTENHPVGRTPHAKRGASV